MSRLLARRSAAAAATRRSPMLLPQHVPAAGMATIKKIVCALYPDPKSGYPPKYARDSIPVIKGYANGQTAPTPKGLDFKPGELLGCVSGALGLKPFCE